MNILVYKIIYGLSSSEADLIIAATLSGSIAGVKILDVLRTKRFGYALSA